MITVTQPPFLQYRPLRDLTLSVGDTVISEDRGWLLLVLGDGRVFSLLGTPRFVDFSQCYLNYRKVDLRIEVLG